MADIPSLVTTYAGVGKIATAEYDAATTGTIPATFANDAIVWSRDGHVFFRAQAGTVVRLSDARGTVSYSGSATGAEDAVPGRLKSGVYILRAGNATRAVVVQ